MLFALVGIFAALLVAPLALAQENATPETSNVTVAPSENLLIAPTTADVNQETITEDLNGTVSAGTIAWKQIGLWFTFNQEKKAQKELELARLRLIQARNAAKNGNMDAMQKALDAHDKLINRVQDRINAIDGKGDAKSVRDSATKLIGLERAIQVHEARIAKLTNLLANENLTDQQKTVIANRLSKAENNTAKLNELEVKKKEQISIKLRAVTNLTEEQINTEIQKIEDAQNLTVVKQLTATIREQKQELQKDISEQKQEITQKIKEQIKNITA